MRFRIIVFSIFAILVISGFGSSNMEMINHLNVFVISPDSDMELIDLSDSLETALATNNKLAQAYNTKIMPPIIPSGLSVAPLETDTSFSPDGVIGDDDRFLINDTTQFPYSAVVLLEIEFEEHNGHVEEASCTGWMLGSSTVVTAGHCVYEPGDDIYAVDILISPGYNIYDQPPAVFNQCDWNRMWILEEWVINGNSQYDLAVIGLECRVGDDTGSLGFLSIEPDDLTNTLGGLDGYPADKGGKSQWMALDPIESANYHYIYHTIDSNTSQSGAAVWEYASGDDCARCAVGIHSGGFSSTQNIGLRITNPIFDLLLVLKSWRYGMSYLPLVINGGGPTGEPLKSLQDPYPAPVIELKNEPVIPVEPYPAP